MEIVTGFSPLTRSELNCLGRCAEGKTDAEIGAELELAPSEVASLITIAVLKLNCPNRLAAMAKATRLGLTIV
ncbi:LuxR C-terminal-related transcriptional regulator [Hoeflea sp. AS60]|uniref:LuxR C-terminal-related transcriptional regulator n=1 Tax=Hoeflea sp. AS60 TaxID=3135780 RepID=UPI0031795389